MTRSSSMHIWMIDDDTILTELYTDVLKNEPEVRRFETFTSAELALDLLRERTDKPDVIFLDLSLPGRGGLQTIEMLIERHPACRIIISSASGDERSVETAFTRGVSGYLVKPYTVRELVEAARDALQGANPVSSSASRHLVRAFLRSTTKSLPLIGLSQREREILMLLVQGYSTREISERLHIKIHTVYTHLKMIFGKYGVSSRVELLSRVSPPTQKPS